MEKAYNLLKKYGRLANSQGYSIGRATKLILKTDEGIFSTLPGADMGNLRKQDIKKLKLDKLPLEKKGIKAMVISQTPYVMEWLKKGKTLIPALDDTAQVVGTKIETIDESSLKGKNCSMEIIRALKKQPACFVRRKSVKEGGYSVVVGRSLYEAVVGMTVLEKACLVEVLGEKLGGTKSLTPVDAEFMRRVYENTYSKAENKARSEEAETGTEESNGSTETLFFKPKSEEAFLREKLVEYGKKLLQCGLVQGTWGNLSVRLNENTMLVTPTGIDYERLCPEDMVKVDIKTLSYEGELKPTSEKALHSEIYKKREDVESIIHTHSTFCSVFAACEKSIDQDTRLAKYALPGGEEIALNCVKALGNNQGCILSHHGMVASGSSLEDAFETTLKMEKKAEECLK